MSTPDYLLWLDFETTGLSDDAELVEVSATLTTAYLEVRLTGDWLLADATPAMSKVQPSGWTMPKWADTRAMEMHETSGLTAAWQEAEQTDGGLTFGATVDVTLSAWIDGLPDLDDDGRRPTVMLAGSGVERFDRRIIARRWPRLDQRLHYACFDVSPVRRVLATLSWAQALAGELGEAAAQATHRSRDDVNAALAQARLLRDYESPLPMGAVPAERFVADEYGIDVSEMRARAAESMRTVAREVVYERLAQQLAALDVDSDTVNALGALAVSGMPADGMNRIARQYCRGQAIYLENETPGAPPVDGIYTRTEPSDG